MKKTVGEKLRDLRTAFGLSQAQFGDRIGITRGSIASYENDINSLTTGAKYKILQTTGIGFDYFDTDMQLWEAFAKYEIDPSNLKLKSLTDTIIAFRNSVKDFANNTQTPKYLNTKIEHLKFMAEYENAECVFVKVVGKEAEPLAKNGDILVVAQDENPENTNWIIAKIGDDTLIKQYLLTGNNEISLKSSSDDSYKFSKVGFEKEVKVLGIIRSKISIEIL
ncbi:helix-turn-helix domain-containing protein [Campylobacter geochelonis]|uniref:helix-turn-helix domain-containing protein n=1 Tax=Campylobacter geochelonis TaxID=1780362 RepID=UPI000770A5EE|nr:helix-turn-helix domain-containing protein [Campylobacter geochelonis]CZE47779.1 transcriptional regulator%2C y4mF family [Campylobacter geochelonis]CZE50879.1 transcriptional regulator%2C y4mF family [Campylobacter geochelonis]